MTEQQAKLLRYLATRIERDGVCPSFENMKDYMGLKSKSGVHRVVTALCERGYAFKHPNKGRAIEITHKGVEAVFGRVLGKCPECGYKR